MSRTRRQAGHRRAGVAFGVVGGIAGAALLLGDALGLASWALFLAWVGYSLLGGSPGRGLRLLVAFVLGALAGWAVVEIGTASERALGAAAMPVALGLVCGALAVLDDVPPLGLGPGSCLGMIAFFAAGAVPGWETVAAVAIPAALGIGCGWLAAILRGTAARHLHTATHHDGIGHDRPA
jgi:hypothetical protein